ncbi:MAG: sigma-70 family RNA polymerase sigma factor [Planctomycetota bacterium]|jgi:RNA polymerase sigma factor for flagellar operon FliA
MLRRPPAVPCLELPARTAAVDPSLNRASWVEGTRAEALERRPQLGRPRKPVDPRVIALWRALEQDRAEGVDDLAEPRNALVEHYQFLVREIVGRFAARLPRTVDRGDLQTAASMGLISAISSFDRSRGVRFEAYGERRIKGALLDELRTQDWLPRPWRQRIELQKRTVERLRSERRREPQDHEVAAEMNLPVDEYQALFGTGLPGAPAGSRAATEGEPEAASALEGLPDPREDSPEERITREELLGLIAQKLTEQEYRIVYLKYWEELPMREIGELTGLSESRVCKIHTRLIERLQERLRVHSGGE